MAGLKKNKKSDTLLRRSEKIELLERYSLFLEQRGYTDIDWRAEPPYAIDEFMKEEEEFSSKGGCVVELGHHWLPDARKPATQDVCLYCGKIRER